MKINIVDSSSKFEKILKSESSISPLTFNDEVLFRSFFELHSEANYSHSWLYTIRSSRSNNGNLSYKFYDGNTLFTLSLRKGAIYVGQIFTKNPDLHALVNLIEKISFTLELPIIFKKLTRNTCRKLEGLELASIADSNLDRSYFEDEAYPERNIRLKTIFDWNTKKIALKRFRNGVGRFINQGIDIRMLRLEEGDFTYKQLKGYLQAVSRLNDDKVDAYSAIINYLMNYTSDPSRYYLRVFFHDKSVEGLYILENLQNNKLGFYCGLTSARWGGITEYLDSIIFMEMMNQGYDEILLGGSETYGVANYVDKLAPYDPDNGFFPVSSCY